MKRLRERKYLKDMVDQRITDKIDQMSLEEKVAQLCGQWISKLIENDHISLEKCRELIPDGIGHIGQFASSTNYEADKMAELLEELQEYVKNETKSKIPILFHEEAITGVALKGAVVFPQMIGMSCSWNPELVYENARISGENMKVDDAVYRVLKLKSDLGLFKEDRKEKQEKINLDLPEYREQSLRSARETIVLLKNNGILPLAAEKKKIAVVGPNADSYYSLLGDYTWGGISEFFYRNPISRENPHLVTFRSK